jgi:hypothetical protein
MSDYVFPPPPQTVHCPKCNRDVVVAVNLGKPGLETDCPKRESECPIASDPSNQPSGQNGTLICFAEGIEGKEQPKPKPDEILQLKPNFYGLGFDLRALCRRVSQWWRGQ